MADATEGNNTNMLWIVLIFIAIIVIGFMWYKNKNSYKTGADEDCDNDVVEMKHDAEEP